MEEEELEEVEELCCLRSCCCCRAKLNAESLRLLPAVELIEEEEEEAEGKGSAALLPAYLLRSRGKVVDVDVVEVACCIAAATIGESS